MYRALSSFSFLVSHKWSSRCCNGSLRRRGCSYYWYHLDLSNYSTKTWKKVFISSIITALSCIDQEFQKDIAMLSTGWVPWLATPQQLLRLTHEPNGQRTWDKLTTFVKRTDKEDGTRGQLWRTQWTKNIGHQLVPASDGGEVDPGGGAGPGTAPEKRQMLSIVTIQWLLAYLWQSKDQCCHLWPCYGHVASKSGDQP